jgi:DNA mismatch endonuclease (patch repair protein)
MNRWPGSASKQRTTFGRLYRSQLMARIRSSGNETTEIRLAKLLRASRLKGWHRHPSLPGRPDFAWRMQRVALFVDGCFWHGHACGRNLSPRTNASAWRRKISLTKRRDRRASRVLRRAGWRVARVWECRLKHHPASTLRRISRLLSTNA